ncbi:MAG: DNA topoisomerase 3 [Bacteroidales bacterium]|nr:DNA topoisomerase 3 [Bacteroidales bacterium]
MIVCIAEKPSVARDIARVIGANKSCDGYMEGNGYQVTWTFGHLCTLKEPHDYRPQWRSWTLGSLPMIPERFGIKLIDDKGIGKQFAVIERLMTHADGIINCGDAGQEGELIQRWVMQKAKATCPVQRLWVSSLTEEAIKEGFANLRPQSDYMSLYEAGLCRAIGDWLLGLNATRLYSLRYRQNSRQVLSIGRVQTPTLALIVHRQQEIERFQSTQYWLLSTIYRDTTFSFCEAASSDDASSEAEGAEKGSTDKRSVKSRFASEAEGQAALRAIEGEPFEVVSVGKKRGSESAPRLFDLTALQVECNKKFSFSADTTLKLIQSLYEKKLTTYPRVDTTYLSDDIYPKCPSILSGLAPYAALTRPLLERKLPKSKKVFDSSKVTDHHAIIPTGVNPATLTLAREEKQVYDLVARRFIAVFYPDCKFTSTTVDGTVAGLRFRATGKQIEDDGWRVVLGNVKTTQEDDEEGEKRLPNFTKGERGPHSPALVEKWTTPPKPYTEASLLRAMETAGKFVEQDELRDALKENGIGRPSTRAAIIETLFRRGYIRKERKALVATATGVDLIGVIQEELLKSAELTGQWEKKLRDIEAHRYSAAQFIDELKAMVSEIVHNVLSDVTGRQVASAETQRPATPRPRKDEAPKKRKASKEKSGATEKSGGRKRAKSSRDVPPAASAGEVVEGAPCPLCGKGHIVRGHTAFGCSEWRAGCTFRYPFPTSS